MTNFYCDASWKDGDGTISYFDSISKTFYVSRKFKSNSSIECECYAAIICLSHSLQYKELEKIIVNTDLELLPSKLNSGQSIAKIPGHIIKCISSMMHVFSDTTEIDVRYASHKTHPIMRLVDLLAYRQLKNIGLNEYKKDVFGDMHTCQIIEFDVELFNYKD